MTKPTQLPPFMRPTAEQLRLSKCPDCDKHFVRVDGELYCPGCWHDAETLHPELRHPAACSASSEIDTDWCQDYDP